VDSRGGKDTQRQREQKRPLDQPKQKEPARILLQNLNKRTIDEGLEGQGARQSEEVKGGMSTRSTSEWGSFTCRAERTCGEGVGLGFASGKNMCGCEKGEKA